MRPAATCMPSACCSLCCCCRSQPGAASACGLLLLAHSLFSLRLLAAWRGFCMQPVAACRRRLLLCRLLLLACSKLVAACCCCCCLQHVLLPHAACCRLGKLCAVCGVLRWSGAADALVDFMTLLMRLLMSLSFPAKVCQNAVVGTRRRR